MDTTNQPARSVKTTETVFGVIETLRELDGATLTELTDELGFAKSTVYDHLSTLEQHGYVIRQDGEYQLSLRFLDHGIYVKRRRDLPDEVEPSLEKLAAETGEVVWFVVEEDGWSYILEMAKGEQAVNTVDRIGRREHLHYHAAGKVILANLPPEETADIIDRHGLPAVTDRTITDRERLDSELEKIRDQGYGTMDSEAVMGLRSVAAPVVSRNQVLGAVSVAGPAKRLRGSLFQEELPRKIQATANAIELQMTYP